MHLLIRQMDWGCRVGLSAAGIRTGDTGLRSRKVTTPDGPAGYRCRIDVGIGVASGMAASRQAKHGGFRPCSSIIDAPALSP